MSCKLFAAPFLREKESKDLLFGKRKDRFEAVEGLRCGTVDRFR